MWILAVFELSQLLCAILFLFILPYVVPAVALVYLCFNGIVDVVCAGIIALPLKLDGSVASNSL